MPRILLVQSAKQNRAGPAFQRHFLEIVWKRGKLSERKRGRSDSVLAINDNDIFIILQTLYEAPQRQLIPCNLPVHKTIFSMRLTIDYR
jgi:hypothetical protein